jgi:hypothetical protein
MYSRVGVHVRLPLDVVAHEPVVQPTLRPGPLGVKPMLQVAWQALPLAVLLPVQLHSAFPGRNAALGVLVQSKAPRAAKWQHARHHCLFEKTQRSIIGRG